MVIAVRNTSKENNCVIQKDVSNLDKKINSFCISNYFAMQGFFKCFVLGATFAAGFVLSAVFLPIAVTVTYSVLTVTLVVGGILFTKSKFFKVNLGDVNLGVLQDTNFRDILKNEIFPIYIKHEKTFDPNGIHGRMHISRCIIYTLAMLNFYKKYYNVKTNDLAALYAIAFHDAGRKGNGVDVWEADSQKLAYDFLIKKEFSIVDADNFSRIINKKYETDGLESIAVRSADCFDIMRCRRGGIKSFRDKLLLFLNDKDPCFSKLKPDDAQKIRQTLIKEIWEFVKITENYKNSLKNSSTYFEDVLFILKINRVLFPELFKLLKVE